MPLLEDVDLVCRLRKLGPPALVHKPITTSARRWQRLGLLQTTLINQVQPLPVSQLLPAELSHKAGCHSAGMTHSSITGQNCVNDEEQAVPLPEDGLDMVG